MTAQDNLWEERLKEMAKTPALKATIASQKEEIGLLRDQLDKLKKSRNKQIKHG